MINLTDLAAQKIKQQIKHRGRGLGVRIGIKTTGCSGLAYILEFVDNEQNNDRLFEVNECKIYIDLKDLPYIKGTTIDYVRNGLNQGFEFQNPNERDRCGCGESFRV